MSAMGSFRADGLPNSSNYAALTGQAISTPTKLIDGANGAVNITDIVLSKNTDGDFSFYNGTGEASQLFFTAYVKANDNGDSIESINFTSALKLNSASGVYVKLDSSNTDYSILANYYVSNTR